MFEVFDHFTFAGELLLHMLKLPVKFSEGLSIVVDLVMVPLLFFFQFSLHMFNAFLKFANFVVVELLDFFCSLAFLSNGSLFRL